MRLEVIGFITILAGVITLLRGPAFGFCLFIPATLLGAAGAVLLSGSGTIQPAHLLLGFLALATLPNRLDWSGARRQLRFPNAAFWLVSFTVVAMTGALILPRLFAGATTIIAVGTTDYGPSAFPVPLGPTSGNLTQSVYIAADLVCFVLCLAFADTIDGFRLLVKILTAYCLLNIAFAIVDLATFWTNTGFLLDFIRNADYQLHVETVVTGLKRIVGFFTETSSFSFATLGVLGFSAELWLSGIRPRLFFSIAFTSTVLLIFSTSTTAYAGTPALLLILYARSVVRVLRSPSPRATHAFVLFAPMVILAAVTAIALTPQAVAYVNDTLSAMVFEKASSQSGIERTQWNVTALRAFVDTDGLGAGLGSVRASSFPIAVVSNCGLLGLALFAAFTGRVLFRRRDCLGRDIVAVRNAGSMACVGLLIAAMISSALVDLGLPFFIFAALACSQPRREGRDALRDSPGTLASDAGGNGRLRAVDRLALGGPTPIESR